MPAGRMARALGQTGTSAAGGRGCCEGGTGTAYTIDATDLSKLFGCFNPCTLPGVIKVMLLVRLRNKRGEKPGCNERTDENF